MRNWRLQAAITLCAGAYGLYRYPEMLGLMFYRAARYLNRDIDEAHLIADRLLADRIVVLNQHIDAVARRAQRQ